MKAISKAMICVLVATGSPAAAAVYELRAATTTVTMDDGTEVPMWGFGLVGAPTVSVPGPVLDVPPGDDTLVVHLTNELPVPVSIVIPGLPAAMTPVWDDGTTGPRTSLAQRVVSFTHVAQPGETVVYEWTNVQPGTYLYQSGTHPAVQVPMGLYGAVRHDGAVTEAYGVAYDRDLVLVYSEVDPALNGAVAGGIYGTPAYPTTIGYRPRYVLVNGQPVSGPPELAVFVNERVLLRVLNAGLRTTVPTLSAGSMRLLAEDGHAAPFARTRYSMLLPAGQTHDALLTLTEPGATVLFDRRGGSRLARITATSAEGVPVAVADSYDATEDTVLDTAAALLPGVLANDTGVGLTALLISTTGAGALALAPDGSFVYTPGGDFHGTDTFRYQASDGAATSNVVTVSIHVAPVNDAPVAVGDAYAASEGVALAVPAPGVLGNDTDVDLDALSAQLVAGPTGGSLTPAADGSFQYTADPGTTLDSFTYVASDGVATSNVATVNITIVPAVNLPPIAVDDRVATLRNTVLMINVLANDSDPDGLIDPRTVVITNQPTRGGTATALEDGTVRYEPRRNFRGVDTFTYVVSDDDGAVSNAAEVAVNVVRP